MTIGSVINIFFVSIVCLLPIVLWGYFFSFVDENTSNKKRFTLGIIAGILSTFPILFLEKIFNLETLKGMNIFANIHSISNVSSYLSSFVSFTFILGGTVLFFTVLAYIFGAKFIEVFRKFVRSFIVFTGGIIAILLCFLLLQLLEANIGFSALRDIQSAPVFMTYAFNSVRLVIFYYICIAFLEESTKHFSFLSGGIGENFNIKKGVLFSIYVALGFAFFENILYGLVIFEENGISGEFFAVVFYRSIFSLFIHVFSSAILGYFFAKSYLYYKAHSFDISFLKFFLSGIIIAIGIHASFDVLITFGGSAFVFIYFILGYFSVSKMLFYNQ